MRCRPLAHGLLVFTLVACSSGPRARVQSALDARDLAAAREAYESFRSVDGDDPALLGRVAALLLREEAESNDPERRDAAMMQLRMGGVAAQWTLDALARDTDHPVARAQALSALDALGQSWVAPYLAVLADSQDPELRALSLAALDVALDRSTLLGALADAHAEVRRAAAVALGKGGPDDATRVALAEVARVDPERGVRVAATNALGSFGPEAVDALRGRLGDPFSSVRLAAVGALLRADAHAGAAAVSALLATPPSPAGIEAARRLSALADGSDTDRESARVYLRAVLHTHDATLRSQAAVALASLADDSMDASLREALASETDRGVRLGLARALMRRDAEAALPTLRALLAGDDMPAIQAAALLAARGEEAAIERLRAALTDEDGLRRRVAARLLAVDAGRPHEILGLLSDADPLVRIQAAGGILAAANR